MNSNPKSKCDGWWMKTKIKLALSENLWIIINFDDKKN